MPTTDRDEPYSAPRGRLPAMLLALLITLSATVTLNVVVNPYGAWPSTVLAPIYRTMNWRTARISAPYRARLEHPHTLLLGNSRVLEGMPISTGLRDGVSNIAMAGATLDEQVALIALALKPGAPRRLVWGVDFFAFNDHYRGFRDHETERRLRGDMWLRARETALSFDALSASARTIVRAAGGRARLSPDERAPVPWQPDAVAAALARLGAPTLPQLDDRTRVQISHWLDFYRRYALAPERVTLFTHAVETVRAAGVELYAFLPPLSLYELEIIRQAGAWPAFLEWKRAVASVTSYWDFSGYEAGANAYPALFDHPYFSHFRPALGHVILRQVLGDSCAACGPLAAQIIAAARHIDGTTVDAHLAAQDAARAAFVRGRSAYTERVRTVWEHTFAVQQIPLGPPFPKGEG